MTNLKCGKTQKLNEWCSFLNDKSIIYIKCFLQTSNSVFCHKPIKSAEFWSNVINNNSSKTGSAVIKKWKNNPRNPMNFQTSKWMVSILFLSKKNCKIQFLKLYSFIEKIKLDFPQQKKRESFLSCF